MTDPTVPGSPEPTPQPAPQQPGAPQPPATPQEPATPQPPAGPPHPAAPQPAPQFSAAPQPPYTAPQSDAQNAQQPPVGAQPPYGQPQYGQPPYGQPPQPYPGQPYAQPAQYAAPSASGRGLGVMALIIGLLPAIFGAFLPLVYSSIYASLGYPQVGLLTGVSSLISVAVGTTAVILGAAAVRRRGPGLVPGAIGIGLGIAVLVSTLLGMLVSFAATGGAYFF